MTRGDSLAATEKVLSTCPRDSKTDTRGCRPGASATMKSPLSATSNDVGTKQPADLVADLHERSHGRAGRIDAVDAMPPAIEHERRAIGAQRETAGVLELAGNERRDATRRPQHLDASGRGEGGPARAAA